jgi:CheY-like chemotaxis protein
MNGDALYSFDRSDGLSVLVVDDEEGVCEFAADALRDAGYLVTTARCAEEALSILARRRVDLLFSDVMMPGMNGFELAARGRSMDAELRVVIASGYFTPALAEALSKGQWPVLAKPYRLASLLEAVWQEFALHPVADSRIQELALPL